MEPLSTVQAEALCHLPSRELDRRRDKNTLPFSLPRRTRYAKQHYSLGQLFTVLMQDQLRDKWHLTAGEAAWACRQMNAQVAAQWELVTKDCWLVREAKPEGVFELSLTDAAGVREFVTQPREDDFEWSQEARAAEAEMRAKGVPDAEITKLLLAIEGERLTSHYKKRPRTIWVLNLTNILTIMEESGRDLGFDLPPREDRAAWFGVPTTK